MEKEERFAYYTASQGLDAWHITTVKDPTLIVSMNDGPCGVRKPALQDFNDQSRIMKATCFPSPSALAASWDEDICYRNGSLLAMDCRQKGVDILLAPGVNIKRSPLCGRNFEYFSEDPLLAGILAGNYIKGLEEHGVGACVKHFCCNNKEWARCIYSVEVSDRALNEIYLTPFKYAIEVGNPTALMTCYNKVNGEYVGESVFFIQEKLRGEYGYKGLIVSDWNAVSDKGAAIKAGENAEMPISSRSYEYIDSLYEEGRFSEDDLKRNDMIAHEAVKKFKDRGEKQTPYDIQSAHEKVSELAAATCVLVKNEKGYFPLNKEEKTLFIGYSPAANHFVGQGSAFVDAYVNEPLMSVLHKEGCDVEYVRGFDENHRLTTSKEELLLYKGKVKKVVICLGSLPMDESEGRDRKSIELPDEQKQVFAWAKEIFDDVSLLIVSGSVWNIKEMYENAEAAMICYLAGEGQGRAIYENLYGIHNPSGHLPECWISDCGQFEGNASLSVPHTYFVYYDEDIYVGYRHYLQNEGKGFVLPFGLGLSYSHFKQSLCEICDEGENIVFLVEVENESDIPGSALVQIYSSMDRSGVYRPKRELKLFKQVTLKGKEKKTLRLYLPKARLTIYSEELGRFALEEGVYRFELCSDAFAVIESKSLAIKGERLPVQQNPRELQRKTPNAAFDLDTPCGAFASCGEKIFWEFFDKEKSDKVNEIYVRMHWNGGEPIRSLASSGLLGFDALLRLIKHYNESGYLVLPNLDSVI